MTPDDRIRLTHMVEALESAISFTQGHEPEDLQTDPMLRFALLHAIQIAGEAALKIDSGIRAAHPDVPWAAIIGMRHRLVHAYADIDHAILWTTATEAVPKLLAQIQVILATG
ncbi:MAG TPA: HepT-like ribonuclease domain-containing protein [Micropepsaceae bacterium]|nr:HepT-like ribonuclease domain-containing protein [Micropepsaceae bacterium]